MQFDADSNLHFDLPFAEKIRINWSAKDPEGLDWAKLTVKPVPGLEDQFFESKY